MYVIKDPDGHTYCLLQWSEFLQRCKFPAEKREKKFVYDFQVFFIKQKKEALVWKALTFLFTKVHRNKNWDFATQHTAVIGQLRV